MGSALERAFRLLFAGDPQILSILSVTLKMTLFSSVTALLLGAPFGVFLASARFPGRRTLILINRTLMGLPPVVVGLAVFLLLSRSGPLGFLGVLLTP